HSWARRASLPSEISPAAHTAPSAKPLATSATRRRERAGPQENPSGRRAASSTTRAHAPAASGTAVPPAKRCTAERRGRLAAVITRDAASARRARRERSGELDMALAHVDARANGEPLEPVPLPAALAQHPGDLTVVDQHIVGPFQARDRAAEQRIHGIRDREPGADGDRPPAPSRRRALRAEQQAEP